MGIILKENNMARPRVEISEDQFKKLCGIQCTLQEIAGFFDCSEDTIENWCKRTFKEGFSDCYKKYSQDGRISLRREQYKLAMKGNCSMLIWLGKQYLGQSEKIDANVKDDHKKEMAEFMEAIKDGKTIQK